MVWFGREKQSDTLVSRPLSPSSTALPRRLRPTKPYTPGHSLSPRKPLVRRLSTLLRLSVEDLSLTGKGLRGRFGRPGGHGNNGQRQRFGRDSRLGGIHPRPLHLPTYLFRFRLCSVQTLVPVSPGHPYDKSRVSDSTQP